MRLMKLMPPAGAGPLPSRPRRLRRPLLDAADRAALGQLAGYLLVLLGAMGVLLLLALTLGLCVRIFLGVM